MANFIESTLEPGEQVIFKGRLHWSFNFRYTAWGLFLILACICGLIYSSMLDDSNSRGVVNIVCIVVAIIGLILIGVGYFIRSKTEFAITNTRFIQKDGILNIKMTEIPLFKVETVNFYQTLWDRMIGTGSIELVGSGGTNHRVDYVQHPHQVRNLIATYMKANKSNGNAAQQ